MGELMNEYKVVLSKAGRDKDSLLVIMGEENGFYLLCDGKERPIERPKKKNVRHIAFTNYSLNSEDTLSNKSLRSALKRCKQ